MYLKSLEIQGFKSFPDKIKLDFDKGLTAVVGPNGSGKSNIGDAVRWVLGEQSTKILRGGKMEDVIFSGTLKRKQVGFAQVILNIDNSSKSLPLDENIISVSRKLYRNGDSEYMINGKNCRLKDILELFMDTGLGKDGYSIIGQGKVAEIVSNKSKERRQIFEEAAGISKFRYKKEESQRRLTAAQENILRLKDIITELESRVEPLRQQSEKAEKFIVLSEEKKSLEIALWLEKSDVLKNDLNTVDEKFLIKNAEYEQLENAINLSDEKIENYYKEMQNSSMKKEVLRNKILEDEKNKSLVISQVAVLENSIEYSKKIIDDLKERQNKSNLSNIEIEKIISEKNAELEGIYRENLLILDEIIKINDKFEKMSCKANDLDSEFSSKTDELNKVFIEKSRLEYTLISSKNSVDEIKNSMEKSEETFFEMEKTVENESKNQAELLDFSRNLNEKKIEHQNKISGFSKLLEQKQNRLENAKKDCIDAKNRHIELSQKYRILSDLEKNMEGFNFSVKEILKAGKNGQISGIFGSVAQIISTKPEYSVAIETALGASLQNVVVENEETAKRGIRLLKETKKGRATFLPLTSVKGSALTERNLDLQDGFIDIASNLIDYDEKFSGIVNSLLGRIVIVENIDCATLIAKKFGYKFRIVTIDGQVINAGGSFTGGSTSKSSGVLSRKNEIENISLQIDEISKKICVSEQNVATLQAETDKLNFDIEGEKQLLIDVNSDEIRTNSELSHIKSLLENLKENINSFEKNNLLLNEKLEIAINGEKSAKNELEKISDTILQLENEVFKSKSSKEEFFEEREKLSAELSEFKLKQLENEKNKEACNLKISQLKETILLNATEFSEIDKSIYDLQEKINSDLIEIENNKKILDNSGENIKEINLQIDKITKESFEFEKNANEERAFLKIKNEEKEVISRDIARFSERKNSIQKEYDLIISELWEQYQLTKSQALETATKLDDVKLAQKKLNEIKSKIKGLGNINVASIEEYKEVSERYENLSTQLKDVENSKKQLLDLIDELTQNMQKMFSESFEQINSNFKEIFVQLFGGGSANLTLTTPEDVLESGIEIEVEPPGKVIKSLSLLSGGEQAFIAIAIYFSILKIKPSPFCILDEIEAALDEVNVSKYAQYLHNFTDTTQFIIITHRRGSMEEADVLYGVTMQEKGVSKLLKMDAKTTVEAQS